MVPFVRFPLMIMEKKHPLFCFRLFCSVVWLASFASWFNTCDGRRTIVSAGYSLVFYAGNLIEHNWANLSSFLAVGLESTVSWPFGFEMITYKMSHSHWTLFPKLILTLTYLMYNKIKDLLFNKLFQNWAPGTRIVFWLTLTILFKFFKKRLRNIIFKLIFFI